MILLPVLVLSLSLPCIHVILIAAERCWGSRLLFVHGLSSHMQINGIIQHHINDKRQEHGTAVLSKLTLIMILQGKFLPYFVYPDFT